MQKLANILLIGSIALSVTACELVISNPNQPDLQGTIDNPTPTTIRGLAQGALIRSRGAAIGNAGQQNGFLSQAGVFGRESYILDTADPRAIGELLGATPDGGTSLNPGNGAFGGNHWGVPYQALQFNELFLEVLESPATAEILSAEEISALVGWAKFHQAYALLVVVNTHVCPAAVADDPLCTNSDELTYGAVLDFQNIDARDASQIEAQYLRDNAPIVNDSAAAFGRVLGLLDEAEAAFAAAGGAEFLFTVPAGFSQFGTPAGMIEVVNAMRARVSLYNDDIPGTLAALEDSFIAEDDTSFAGGPSADIGVFHDYSTDSNDSANQLGADVNLLGHPSLGLGEADGGVLQFQADGTTPDARFSSKTSRIAEPVSIDMLTSDIRFTGLYNVQSQDTPVPYIRNEELLLIKAEALARSGDLAEATTLVNAVRVASGGLEPLADFTSEDEAIDAILYERTYSLLFEGGHRWLDYRRLGRTDELPLDRMSDLVNLAWPVELDEINARVVETAGDE